MLIPSFSDKMLYGFKTMGKFILKMLINKVFNKNLKKIIKSKKSSLL
jgi:hypothetical protein